MDTNVWEAIVAAAGALVAASNVANNYMVYKLNRQSAEHGKVSLENQKVSLENKAAIEAVSQQIEVHAARTEELAATRTTA